MADPRIVQAMMARAGVSPVLSDPRQFPTPTPDQEALEDPLISPETYGAGSALRKGGALAGMTVFHGSPHRFPPTDKNPLGEFDAAKIGTGEGAQAYGYGHYFAENPAVAKDYKEMLQTTAPHLDGKKMLPSDSNFLAAQTIAMNGYNRALSDARRVSNAALVHHIKELKKSKITIEPTGSLYTVDLPDDQIAKMLDWDANLSVQPESVRAVTAALVERAAKSLPDIRGRDTTGRGLYRALQEYKGGDAMGTSDAFMKAGIPGIKFLDAASRRRGSGTSNFVVFPGAERIPKIIERHE